MTSTETAPVLDEVTVAALKKLRGDLRRLDKQLAWVLVQRRATANTIDLIEDGENVHDPATHQEALATFKRLLGNADGQVFASAVHQICRWPGDHRRSAPTAASSSEPPCPDPTG